MSFPFVREVKLRSYSAAECWWQKWKKAIQSFLRLAYRDLPETNFPFFVTFSFLSSIDQFMRSLYNATLLSGRAYHRRTSPTASVERGISRMQLVAFGGGKNVSCFCLLFFLLISLTSLFCFEPLNRCLYPSFRDVSRDLTLLKVPGLGADML